MPDVPVTEAEDPPRPVRDAAGYVPDSEELSGMPAPVEESAEVGLAQKGTDEAAVIRRETAI